MAELTKGGGFDSERPQLVSTESNTGSSISPHDIETSMPGDSQVASVEPESSAFGLPVGVEASKPDHSQVASIEPKSSAVDSTSISEPIDSPVASMEPKSSVIASVIDMTMIKHDDSVDLLSPLDATSQRKQPTRNRDSRSGQSGVITEKTTPVSSYFGTLRKNKTASKEMKDFKGEVELDSERIERKRVNRPATVNLDELEESPSGQSGALTEKVTPESSYLSALRNNKRTSKEWADLNRELALDWERIKRKRVNQPATVNLDELEESPSGQSGALTEKVTPESSYLSTLRKNKRTSKEWADLNRELALDWEIIKKKRCASIIVAAKEGTICCQSCWKPITDPVSAPCGHVFCESCIEQAFSKTCLKTKYCPMCRIKLPRKDKYHKIFLPNSS